MNKIVVFSLLLFPSALCGFIGAFINYKLLQNNINHNKLITALTSLLPPIILAGLIYIPKYDSHLNDAPMLIIGLVIGGFLTSFVSFTTYEISERILSKKQ
jgi:hypothetical protein